MRLALVNWSSRRAGGAEAYLAGLIPALSTAGHEVRLWREEDGPADREPITAAPTMPLAEPDSIDRLRDWKPDLVYCHGLKNPAREKRVIEVAPAIFFAHSYYGTCISGTKTWSFPEVRPCTRRFGPGCLAHFYPHRCGGLNPLTMLHDYSMQGSRLALLPRYRAIVTNSGHMREEYLRHGLAADRVYQLTFPVNESPTPAPSRGLPSQPNAIRLAFVGRMDRLKGGEFLLSALLRVREALQRPLVTTFAGDGPQRTRWEERAAVLSASDPTLSFVFPGWLNRVGIDQLFAATDLLVFPSVWPEPFGLAGPEAGLRGVPVAAFATGGVSEWLKDGVNGFAAPGDHPRAADLADAIVKCVRDPSVHARLREGAVRIAKQFTMEAHLRELFHVFERARA